jgi:hypothetical protein
LVNDAERAVMWAIFDWCREIDGVEAPEAPKNYQTFLSLLSIAKQAH